MQCIPKVEIGGNTLHSAESGSAFLPMNRNWPYRYHNWQYQFCNWTYRYTDYSMPFAANQSLSVYVIVDTHWVFFSFSFPRNWNIFFNFKLCKVLTVFHFTNFYCINLFLFGQSLKRLSPECLNCKCEHRHFYIVTSVGLVSYCILADPGPRGELLTKQTSFLMQLDVQLAKNKL